ncbi:RNA-directed DNA polymerase, eukaryota, reverse transcriptase zinc-binding domain protein [Tanacetum coccineum]
MLSSSTTDLSSSNFKIIIKSFNLNSLSHLKIFRSDKTCDDNERDKITENSEDTNPSSLGGTKKTGSTKKDDGGHPSTSEAATNEEVDGVTHENDYMSEGDDLYGDFNQRFQQSVEQTNEFNTLDNQNIGLRMSSRKSVLPVKLQDFKLNTSVKYSIDNHVNYSKLSLENFNFSTSLNKIKEPKSYDEAASDIRWIEAMNLEMKALNRNGTWVITEIPEGRKAIGFKWVWKVKYKSSGEVERFKARLVAKDLGKLKYFLGIEVLESDNNLYLSKRKYCLEVLAEFGIGIVSMQTLKRALDKFSAITGLHPNLEKCTMFGGSLDDETKSAISSIFPFKEGKLPVRCLGVPLVTKKIGVSDCKQLMDKVNQRLYKKFLWNSGDSGKGRAKVAWLDMCKPKYQGGLRFKSLEVCNKTLLVKHLWNVAVKKESLWVKWINVVKLKQRSVWDVDVDPKDSWGWKCLLNVKSWVGEHMRYRIGDGKSIRIWHDKWYNGTSLSSFIRKKDVFYVGFNNLSKVSDLIDDNGWRWPQNWLIKHPWLSMIQVPVLSNTPDKLVWVDNNAAKQKLCTQDRLSRWYPNKVFECSLCQKDLDSHDHLFFNCEYAQKFWKQVCDMARMKFKNFSWDARLNEMSKGKNKHSVWEVIKKLCHAAAVYYIWQERNLRLFNNSKREATDLFGIMIEELRAKMVSITLIYLVL